MTKYQDKKKLINKLKADTGWLAFLNDKDDSAFVSFLLKKYGPVLGDYTNAKIKRGKEGLEVHHINENQIANLCDSQYFDTEHQKSENLVYANYNEHAVLHYLIGKQQNGLGLGGLYNHGLLQRCEKYMQPTHYIMFKTLVDNLGKKTIEKNNTPEKILNRLEQLKNFLKEQKEIEEKRKNFCLSLQEGINEIFPQDYYDYIAPSEKILKYDKVFAICHKQLYAFCTINKKQETILWYQKQPHKIKHNPQLVYNNLSDIYAKQEAFRQNLKNISSKIKSCYKEQTIWLNGIALYYGQGVFAQQIAFFDTLKHALIVPTDVDETLIDALFQDDSLPLIYDDKLFLHYKQINKDFIKITNCSNILYSLEDPESLYSTN